MDSTLHSSRLSPEPHLGQAGHLSKTLPAGNCGCWEAGRQDRWGCSEPRAHDARPASGSTSCHLCTSHAELEAAELREAGTAAAVPSLGVGWDVCLTASCVPTPPGPGSPGKGRPRQLAAPAAGAGADVVIPGVSPECGLRGRPLPMHLPLSSAGCPHSPAGVPLETAQGVTAEACWLHPETARLTCRGQCGRGRMPGTQSWHRTRMPRLVHSLI